MGFQSQLFEGEKVFDHTNYHELVGDGRVVVAGGEPRLLSRIPPPLGASVDHFAISFEAAGLTVIPRSEWSDRVKDQIAKESRISDLQDFPPFDQDGLPTCHTADTEVLTEKGWTPWPDYNGADLLATMNQQTGLLEFQSCLQRHAFEYDGQTIHSTNRRLDFGVTPDHRMLVRKWDERNRTLSKTFEFETAGNLGWYVGLPHSTSGWLGANILRVSIDGDREYDGDDFIALLGLIASDGWAGGTENTENLVSFCCFRDSKREQVAALASRLGFHEAPSRPGVWLRYGAGALANWMRQNCYADSRLGALRKRVPDIVKCASMRQITHFLDFFGDRLHEGVDEMFYTSSPRMGGDLQELHLRIGKRSTLLTEKVAGGALPGGRTIGATVRYRLTVSRTDRLCLDRKKHIETDHYKGVVYCATVPNSTLVTRRNGTVLISGNCWANGPSQAYTTAERIAGMAYDPISACSLAVPISGGHSGGYEGDALAYLIKHGGVVQSLWPNNDTSRSHMQDEACIACRSKHMALMSVDLGSDFEKYATACLLGIPYAFAYNWMSHVMSGGDLVEIEPGHFGLRQRNSWGKWGAANKWGFYGYNVWAEGHGTPDSGFGLQQITATSKV